ncbi:MAG: hypothetical protein ABFD90_01890 [Phycisphaerales bacterium]
MIATKTVLILGAGASKPYGFPVGNELVSQIREFTAPPQSGNFCKAFQEWVGVNAGKTELALWANAADEMKSLNHELGKCRPHSIDEFLERRKDVADVGRLAIGFLLLRAEEESANHLWSDNVEGHWYDYLKSRLVNPSETLAQDQLRIITFNYDRSLEHYLFESLKPYYSQDMTEEEYTTAMKRFQFLHIYGSLGPLPWQSATGAVPYPSRGYGPILTAAKNIRVLHQGKDDIVQQNFTIAQEWLKWADRILFLGFGFHKDNVGRLALDSVLKPQQTISGTCRDLDRTSKNRVEYCTEWATRPEHTCYGHPARSTIEFPDKDAKCYEFLHDHADLS